LKVLVELLDEDFAEQSKLIVHVLNGIGSMFEPMVRAAKSDLHKE